MALNIDQRIKLRKRLDALIGCSLEVWEADRFGRKIGGYIKKPVDIITDQFGTFLANMLAAYINATNLHVTCTMKDTANASKTIAFYTTQYPAGLSSYQKLGGLVGVGHGTTAVARTDYNLQSQDGSWTALSGNAVWTSATGKVTFAGSVLLAAGADVTEAGLEVNLSTTTYTLGSFLFLHDVFSVVPIAAGKYAHVAYELQL